MSSHCNLREPAGDLCPLPVIGVPACRKFIAPHPFHSVGEKYITAVASAAQALPMLLPALGAALPVQRVLDLCDGLLFTGSPSNVEPWRYGEKPDDPDMLTDPHRDATTLPLMREAIGQGVPVLAICRGFQELNVAYGGKLHRRVQEVRHLSDHREDKAAPLDEQYRPSHDVDLRLGGQLATLFNTEKLAVNSLHSQGIKTLGDGLQAEATAPDGLIEGFSVADAPSFALAVQWHPEWRVLENCHSRALFEAFGEACRQRARTR